MSTDCTFEQELLTLDEMNLILRALEWAMQDKNNPKGLCKKMEPLRAKIQKRLSEIVAQY